MKKRLPVILLLLLIFALAVFVYITRQEPQEVHYHAGFKVFVDGTNVNFSDPKYMSLIPCSDTHEVTQNPQIEQLEKAHLHDQNGNVVHVHRDGATWGDLFQNIDYQFDETKELKAYINGVEVANIFQQIIQPYQSLIILVGSRDVSLDYFDKAVTREEIEAAESESELCAKK